MRSFSLFTASTLLLLGVTGCPVKETCADGFMASGDDCVPIVIIDMGPRDAGDAGPRDAGDAAVMDEGVDEGIDEGTPDAGPCGMPCTGATVVCDEARGMCAECTATDADACVGATPVCDTTSGSATEGSCVACNVDSDCTSLAAAQCDVATHACVPCTGNGACTGRAGTVCGAGTCVECTGADRTPCGANVCDVTTRTCSTFPAGMTGLCQTCVSDAQCRAGQLCVPMTFDTPARPVGNFCLWRQDATGTGAPAGDCFAVRPYVRAALATMSIESVSATVCGLRSTTCPALNDFSMRNCMTLDTAGDDRCGATGFDDGLCRSAGATTNRCTVECASDDDCISTSTCDTSVTPRVCLF